MFFPQRDALPSSVSKAGLCLLLNPVTLSVIIIYEYFSLLVYCISSRLKSLCVQGSVLFIFVSPEPGTVFDTFIINYVNG